jgi:streptogramin lyase
MNKLLLGVFSFIVLNTATRAQAPNITYTTPQTYTYGNAITQLSPTNTGGAVPNNLYGKLTLLAGGQSGSVNGTGTNAGFNNLLGIAVDKNNNIYVADQGSNLIRKVTPGGVVTTFAGSGNATFADGTGTAASFNTPSGLVFDATGNLFVADRYNNRIRKITPEGVVSTFAGSGSTGNSNGTGAAASFWLPCGITIDASGNLFVADQVNNMIRKITPAAVVTTFAGSGQIGLQNGTGTSASFYYPTGVIFDANNNLYVADNLNNTIRKITPAGVVTTFAGNGYTGSADGTGNMASFNQTTGVASDPFGNIYVADQYNNRIRKISPAGEVSTIPVILTGATGLSRPSALVYLNGKLFISNQGDNTIRVLNLDGFTINKPLPEGLLFDATSGIITGTPTALSPATDYLITAINESGLGSTSINISVIISALPPVITSFAPSSSIVGNTLAINGTNLLGATAVSIGGKTVTKFRLASPSQIAATIPQGATTGNVSVTNQYGTATLTGFSILSAPAISYNTPQTLTTGVAAAPVTVTNNGGPVPAKFYADSVRVAGGCSAG